MHRVQLAVKSPICVEISSKIVYIFCVTKATDLKIVFLKNLWKIDVETCVTLIFVKKKKNIFYIFLPFFLAFFQPSLAPKFNWSYRSNLFYYELTLKNWAMNMHLNPIPII